MLPSGWHTRGALSACATRGWQPRRARTAARSLSGCEAIVLRHASLTHPSLPALCSAGTYAYVTAGHVGKAVLTAGEGGGGLNMDTWHVGLALGATVLALGFVGRLAQQAVEEADREALAEAAAEAAAKAAAKAGPGQAPPAVAQHSLKYGNGSKPPPSSSL